LRLAIADFRLQSRSAD